MPLPACAAGSPSHRPAPVDDDENIFDDDGEEYKPERRAPGAAPVPPLPGPAGRGAYFGGAEEGQLISPTQGGQGGLQIEVHMPYELLMQC